MSEATTSLQDIMAALPAASDAAGKSVVLTDANGEMSKIDAEGMMILTICKVLFGANVVRTTRSTNDYNHADWKTFASQETYWSPFFMSNTNAGDICVVFGHTKDGNPVSFVLIALDKETLANDKHLRILRPIALFIRGYKPFWSPLAPSV